MRNQRSAWVLGTLLLAGCQGTDQVLESRLTVLTDPPTIVAEQITVDELPAEFDASRTFSRHSANLEDPEGLLRALWAKEIRSTRAWQPKDNPMCLDPVGPTFTVELAADDPRILDLGFQRGVGRLFCSTRLTAYRVSEHAEAR